ncbi:hypothetical protein ES703_62668 [subsurface metagenome]
MWYRKEKIWSNYKFNLSLGYDLWGWALPLLLDIDYGIFEIKILCFRLKFEWDWD